MLTTDLQERISFPKIEVVVTPAEATAKLNTNFVLAQLEESMQ
jgi:hypothetical protein